MIFQLEEMVQKPTWKQVLLDLILSERLDPWNIDIIKITNGFLLKVKEMRKLELFVPANMILASAILLRYKSEVLRFHEQNVAEDLLANEEEAIEKPQIEELKLLSRIPPKRPITISELLGELDKVLKYEEEKGKIEKGKIEAIMNLKIEGKDIEKQMQEVYDLILKQMNGGEHVLFSNLISENEERKEVIYTLLSLLHLTQENKIGIEQKELFGEIFIWPEKNKNYTKTTN